MGIVEHVESSAKEHPSESGQRQKGHELLEDGNGDICSFLHAPALRVLPGYVK